MRKLYCLLTSLSFIIHIVAQVPVIAGFTPATGNPGTLVTISGTNFGPTPKDNTVYFGACRGFVLFATDTNIKVLVPVGATCKPITILNSKVGLAVTSNLSFIPTFSPTKGSITSADFLDKVEFPTLVKPSSVALADFNNDSKADVVITHDVNLSRVNTYSLSGYFNNAVTGSIDNTSLIGGYLPNSGDRPQAVTVGDFDLDGRLEYASANYASNNVSLMATSSPYSYIAPLSSGFGPIDVAISDIDLDGKPDVISADALSFGISVFKNVKSSNIIFNPGAGFLTGFQPVAIAIGDLNLDGKPEIVIVNDNNDSTVGLSILSNTSSPGNIDSSSFAPVVNFTTGPFPRGVALADIDGDGKLDLIVANQKGNNLSILHNNSTGGDITTASFDAKVDFAAGTKPKSIAVGDLDGDGKPDIAVTNQLDNTVSVYRNTSVPGSITSTSLAQQITIPTGQLPCSVAIADLDGDGRPDIIVANYNSGSISVIKNEPLVFGFNTPGKNSNTLSQTLDGLRERKNLNAFKANIFPNPAVDFTTLSINKAHGAVELLLLDALGKAVWKKKNVRDNIIRIPVNSLPSGLYFLSINDYANPVTLKLLKQ